MAVEVFRKLIGGVWRTVVEDAGGNGGSQPGVPIVRSFPFRFDTPGISSGGYSFYTPTIGDYLLDAWVSIDVAWDGLTPTADIGSAAPTSPGGLFAYAIGVGVCLDMSLADYFFSSTQFQQSQVTSLSAISAVGEAVDMLQVPAIPAGGAPQQNVTRNVMETNLLFPAVPVKLVTDEHLAIWVTRDGQRNGASPGSSQGEATLFVMTVTPAT